MEREDSTPQRGAGVQERGNDQFKLFDGQDVSSILPAAMVKPRPHQTRNKGYTNVHVETD
jgi:hypothetical protein